MSTVAKLPKKEVDILQNKIDKMLNNNKASNASTLKSIEKMGEQLEDFVAPIGTENTGKNPMSFSSNGVVSMNIEKNKFKMHPHAVSQLGQKLGVPTKYIKDLAYGDEQWQRDLAADILQKHGDNTDRQRLLLRSVGGEIRGVLSDKYRRFSTTEVMASFYTAAGAQGAVAWKAEMTDTKVFTEVIVPKVFQIPTENGVEVMVFGASLSNSDFGAASLQIKTFMMKVVCLNGMTRSNMLRSVHLGSRWNDNVVLSNQTYELDSRTQASAVRDVVAGALSPKVLEKNMMDINKASTIQIDYDNVLEKLQPLGMLKAEVETVGRKLRDRNPNDGIPNGKPSLWTLTNAITAVGKDVEGERQRELGDISNKLWEKFNIK